MPHHEHKWCSSGKTSMSGPISAMTFSILVRLRPGMSSRRWNASCGSKASSRCAIRTLNCSLWLPDSSRGSTVVPAKSGDARCSSLPTPASVAGILPRSRPSAKSAILSVSSSPRNKARNIARPDLPNTSEATAPNLMLASSSSLWMRLATRVCSPANCARLACQVTQFAYRPAAAQSCPAISRVPTTAQSIPRRSRRSCVPAPS